MDSSDLISPSTKTQENSIYSDIGIVLNIFNTIIGVGIITLPNAMRIGGAYFVVACSLLVVYLIYYTSMLMVRSSQTRPNIRSYGELCNAAYGAWLRYTLCILMFLLMYGYVVVYSITFRLELQDIISDFTGSTFKYGNYTFLAAAVVLMLPPTLLKDISKLSFLSFVSLICVITFTAIACFKSLPYHRHMTAMTKFSVIKVEKNLGAERAEYICALAIDPTKFIISRDLGNWGSLKIANLDQVSIVLKSSQACGVFKRTWDSVSAELVRISEDPKINMVTAKANNINSKNWAEVLGYEHSRYIFDSYSLNDEGAESRKFNLHSFARSGFFSTVGIMASAFVYEQATIPLFYSMKKPMYRRYTIIVIVGFAISFAFTMVVAFVGYFGQSYQTGRFIYTKLKPRFFGLDSPDIAISVARIALVTSICLTYPMQFYFGRWNLMIAIVAVMNKVRGESRDTQKPSNLVFYATTLGMFGIAVLLGIFLEEAQIFFGIVGALFAGPLIYIFPIVCWYGMMGGIGKVMSEAMGSGSMREKFSRIIFPVSVILFGLIATVSSTVYGIIDLINAS